MKLVYIAGPYTNGSVEDNVRAAVLMGDVLARQGHAVYIPHLMHHWNKEIPHVYTFWMIICLEIVSRCDAVLRLPGESLGADLECDRAKACGIPVFKTIEELNYWFSSALAE